MTPTHPQRAVEIDPRHVEAARSVIVELFQILAAYRRGMVLIGGWVPELLFPSAKPPHTGSIDVDLLLNPQELAGEQYAGLIAQIDARGYRQTDEPFRFSKAVAVGGGDPVSVDVEFLVPKGWRRRRSGRLVPGFRAIEADGAHLAIASTATRTVAGVMPSGARNRVEVVLPSPEAFVVMKAHALGGRLKEKDAYDIVFCLQNWPGGSAAIGEALRHHHAEPEVTRALAILAEKFSSPEDLGPQSVAAFLDPADPDEREFVARDAYERVQALLGALGQAGKGV
jgi:hypothetical protein